MPLQILDVDSLRKSWGINNFSQVFPYTLHPNSMPNAQCPMPNAQCPMP
ncbi:MAG: hypothetical protein F6J93_23265 [Oscillatoria sp. SIO1A7]|nr:hypothetical protein [Oscillatoria sp. SIO1A7]